MKGRKRLLARVAPVAVIALFGAAALAVALGGSAFAMSESSVPAAAAQAAPEAPPPPPPGAMKVVPAEEESAVATPRAEKTPRPARKRRTVHRRHIEVEPASGWLKIKQDAWILTGPSRWTKHIKRGHAGKYVIVTGATRYYLRVKLKNGETGYILASAVDLVKPTDKIFRLTSNAAVLAKPNRWAKKLAEVHQGRNVHVTGIALSYIRIRMRSGLVGFIPASALQ